VTRGFLLGRFMPPHAGHVLLCETARRSVDELTILVCWQPADPIPGPLRLAWMRELFPACRVVGRDTGLPHAPGERLEIVRAAHPEPIDRLFAGEAHGKRLAGDVGAEFVLVGPRLYPDLSGSAVRADPWAHWKLLPAPVRAHFARTICLHGPESTGKSTLSAPLAEHFGTIWVPEYGRVHCEVHGFDLDAAGLTTIGRTQSAMTRAALPWCNRRLIIDTDALTTAAWSIMLLGHVPDGVLEGLPLADLYLLTDIDIPWEDDGTRYFPEPKARARFMAACERVLDEAGANRVRIKGGVEERFAQAVAAIEALGPPASS
jgi:NadR type nicotinamide-nucleotide adenylyltransferase